MIKLYKKKFITNSSVKYAYKYEFEAYLPKVIKTGYKKYYKGVWEATVLVKRDETNEKVLNNLKDYLFQIYDKNGEYIGAFIPNKPDEAILNKQSTITINCNHALITLLDSIFPEDIETDSEDVNSLFTRVLSHQKQRIWEYRESAHANEATDIKLEKQNGLLSPFLKIAEQLSPLYYFSYDTEGEFPWTISLNRVTDTPTARIREGYNLLDYKLTSDPSNIYNRLYVYGEVEELTNAVLNDRVDAKEIQKENEAWRKYQSDYAAWKNEQIQMQKKRDLALKRREELVNSGASSSELPKLPPRPSTIAPPQKPSISSRKMKRSRVTITTANPSAQEYLEDVDSIKTYGLKERILELKDISDPTLLYNMAKKIFENRTNEVYDYSINAADLNKLLVKPIPFNWIRLGTTISFQTYRAGKAIEDDLVIVEESKQDIDGASEKISVTLQLKNSASAPVVSNSTASQLLSKIEETEADIIKAYKSADGKNTIYSGKDQPPNPKVNDIWYKQTLDDKGKPTIEMWIFNGSIWINPFDDVDKISQLIEANEKELDKFDNENKKLMATLESDINALNTDVTNANKKIREEITAKANKLNEQLKNLDTKLSKDLNDKVDSINSTISTLEQNFKDSLDNKEAEILQQTKVVIDEKLQTIKTTIGKQENKLGELVTKITDITTSLDGLSAKVVAVEKSESEQNKKLAELDVSISGIKTTVANLQESQNSTTKLINETKQTAEANKQAISKETSNREAAIKATNEKINTATSDISKLSETVKSNNETTTSKINEVVKDVNSTKETISSLSSDNETRFNKIEKDVNSNTSTIASYKTKIDSNTTLVESTASKISQTDKKVETIITSYAKKSDLNGLMNEEQVTTIATAEAGKIKTTLSSQISTIDDKVNGIKARPTYTIGSDGYWYKDGKKTDTKAIGADGKTGKDGGEFGWNLLLDGDTRITDSKNFLIKIYTLDEDIPDGTVASLVVRFKGKRLSNKIMVYSQSASGSEKALPDIVLPYDSDDEFRTYVTTGKWKCRKESTNKINLYIGIYSDDNFPPVSIEWAKLVYGDKPTMQFAPPKSVMRGKTGPPGKDGKTGPQGPRGADGKDAKVYKSSSAPSDTSLLWYNTNDNEVYVYYNGSWRNINSTIKTKLNTVSDTVDSHKRTISEYETKFTNMGRDIRTNLNKISTVEQNLDSFKTTVKNQNYLSIINQQAGKQVFQVSNGRTTGKLMITPETVYIKDATINNAHISSLSASKLTFGTLDGKNVNVINLNASSITTGKLSGYRGYWNLNDGEFYNGYYSSNIRLSNGIAKFSDSYGEGVVIESGMLSLSTNISSSSSYTKVGELCGGSKWNGTKDLKNVRLAHRQGTTMTLSYYDGNYYYPYIVFDKYSAYRTAFDLIGGTIIVIEPLTLRNNLYVNPYNCIRFGITRCIAGFRGTKKNGSKFDGIFIGYHKDGLYISSEGVFTMFNNSYQNIGNSDIKIESYAVDENL